MVKQYDIEIPFSSEYLTSHSLTAVYYNDECYTAKEIRYLYNTINIELEDKDLIVKYYEIKEIKKSKSELTIILDNKEKYKLVPEFISDIDKIYNHIRLFKSEIISIPNSLLFSNIEKNYIKVNNNEDDFLVFFNLIKNIAIDNYFLYIEYYDNNRLKENYNIRINIINDEEKAAYQKLIDYLHELKRKTIPKVSFSWYKEYESSGIEEGDVFETEDDYLHIYSYEQEIGKSRKITSSYKVKYRDIKKFDVLFLSEERVRFNITTEKVHKDEISKNQTVKDFDKLSYMNPEIIYVEKINQFFNGEDIPTMLKETNQCSNNKNNNISYRKIFISIIISLIIALIVSFIMSIVIDVPKYAFFFTWGILFIIFVFKKEKNTSNTITSNNINNSSNSKLVNYKLSNDTGIGIDNDSKEVWIYDNSTSPTKVDFDQIRNVEIIDELSADIVPQNEALYDISTITGNEKGREYLAERKKTVKKCDSLEVKITVEKAENIVDTITIRLIDDRIDTSNSYYKNARDLSKKIETVLNNIISKNGKEV